jgi:hypothetical protein
MSSYILEYVSEKPIHAVDSLSMYEWRLDCEAEWEDITEFLELPPSSLLETIMDAFCDLAEKSEEIPPWSLEDRKKSIEILLLRPQVEQRTESWYLEAQKMLTASQFSTILQTGLTRGKLVLEKAEGKTDTSQRRTVVLSSDLNPFTWGIRFEPIVKQIYCDITKTVVKDMGRLKHFTDPRLAASPDGMVIEGPDERLGRFVEFKAPVTRVLNQTVPKDYMTQMQIQMEVGGVEECDYFEVKFISTFRQKTPELPTIAKYYGDIHIINNEELIRYEYSPLNTKGWLPELKPNEEIIETIPWVTNEFFMKPIPRSRAWFSSVQPIIESFWRDVEFAKKGEYILPESSRKRKMECKIIDE